MARGDPRSRRGSSVAGRHGIRFSGIAGLRFAVMAGWGKHAAAIFWAIATGSALIGACGSNAPSPVPNGGLPPKVKGMPSVTFNGCVIPAGQPTWANLLLTDLRAPIRAVWSIDGMVDSRDPQRTVLAPGKGTRLELLVKLHSIGQTFRIQVIDARGPAGSYTFTNTGRSPVCNANGEPRTR